MSLGLAILGALLLAACSQQPTNLVVVTIDTLRADHLPCYGYSRDTAPNVCGLAAEGTLFENAISQSSWTLPAHASMMTGRYPAEHGAVNFYTPIAPDVPILAEQLRARGLATAAFVSTIFLEKHGFERGFDVFERIRDERMAEPVTERALAWLAEIREPFFLWVHYYDPHHEHLMHPGIGLAYPDGAEGPISYPGWNLFPQRAPKAFARNRERHLARYDGEIRYVDDHVGRLLDALRASGRFERTIVAVTSDHGEAFGDHGLVGHDHFLYEELIAVPLILRIPGRPPSRERRLAETRELMPTLLDLLGVPQPPGVQGSLLDGERSFAFAEVHSRNTDPRASVTHGRWKLIYTFGPGAAELYDLEADPTESENLSTREPATVKRLEQALFARTGMVESDPGMLEELRALGYVD